MAVQIIYVFHILGPVSLKVKVPILFLLQPVIYLFLHYIVLIVFFVKILFLILIAFTKFNLFFVTSSKHWVRVFCKI